MKFSSCVFAAVMALSVIASGCKSGPPKADPVKARISASTDVNPNAEGRASPVHVRIFQLKEDGAFVGADFWALVDKETETLGGSLVQRQEHDLVPGESKDIELKVQPDARVLGVMAEFANYRNAQWRVVAKAPNKTLTDLIKKDRVTIRIDKDKATIVVGD
jgi:type VI secretion system protein VasD